MENKICENCRHFRQHYIKKNTKFSLVNCGHCSKKNNFKTNLLSDCKYWEDDGIIKEEREQAIKKTLENMSIDLKQIAAVLTNGE